MFCGNTQKHVCTRRSSHSAYFGSVSGTIWTSLFPLCQYFLHPHIYIWCVTVLFHFLKCMNFAVYIGENIFCDKKERFVLKIYLS